MLSVLLLFSFTTVCGQKYYEDTYVIKNLKINSKKQHYNLTPLFKNKVIFASAKPNAEHPILYTANRDTNGEISKVEQLKLINKNILVKDISFHFETNLVVFSGTYKKNNQNIQLFTASLSEDGNITNIKEFKYNNSAVSLDFPSISSDGKLLYFSATLPSSYGGFDIYKAPINPNGSFSSIEHLDQTINTTKDEIHPYLSSSNTLYFSSNGMDGYGGYDIYNSKLLKGIYSTPVNLEIPFNSPFDDITFVVNENNHSGYFSSNRNTGKGDLDLYYFNLEEKKCQQKLNATIKDIKTMNPVENASIVLYKNGDLVEHIIATNDGYASFDIDCDSFYKIIATKDGYTDTKTDFISGKSSDILLEKGLILSPDNCNKNYHISILDKDGNPIPNAVVEIYNSSNNLVTKIANQNGDIFFDFPCNNPLYHLTFKKFGFQNGMMRLQLKNIRPDSISSVIHLVKEKALVQEIKNQNKLKKNSKKRLKNNKLAIDHIDFDLNESTIRPEGIIELNKVLVLLRENPSIKVRIESHTDSRGNDNLNKKLTEERAKACKKYLIEKGIEANRLSAKGYGESEPLNHCKNNVRCSDAEHNKNKRTEFIIIEGNTTF